MSSIEQNAPVGRDVRTSALDALRAVLDLAATEPDDGVAIRTGVDPTLRFRGLTWGELRQVVPESKAEAYRDLSSALLKQRDELPSWNASGRRLGLEDAARIARAAGDALTGGAQ